jgi:hypothetical protein
MATHVHARSLPMFAERFASGATEYESVSDAERARLACEGREKCVVVIG